MSTALFVALTLVLYDGLCDQDTPCYITLDGAHVPLTASGFVDDTVLFSGDWSAAQRALDACSDWAHHIRMLFNLGADKSAVLISQQLGSQSHRDLYLCGKPLPRTSSYRYLGALLSATGCVGAALKDMGDRVLRKTGTMVGWARVNQVPLAFLERLWIQYVEPLVWWLVAAIPLAPAQVRWVDLLQRKAGCMLLGHNKRSPRPSPLACLGWVPWSYLHGACRLSLWGRMRHDENNLMQRIFGMCLPRIPRPIVSLSGLI